MAVRTRPTTYEVECDACHELRWPMLASRPLSYTCIRCRAVPEAKRAARREQAARGAKSRQKARQDATGAV
jgi:hypothetical protein